MNLLQVDQLQFSKVIFLSQNNIDFGHLILGLDSASSTELLTHLNALAASNRTVVLTIHQPRLEIFHMFHRIIVLSDGKVRVNRYHYTLFHQECQLIIGFRYILVRRV